MSYWGNTYIPGMRGAAEDFIKEFVNLTFPGEHVMDCDGDERPKSELMEIIKARFDTLDDEFEPGREYGETASGGYELELLDLMRDIMTDVMFFDWA